MSKTPISVTIITLNEEKKIAAAIESVTWADEVIVVDSGSTDRTCEIAERLGAKVMHHAWLGYGQQKNFAQAQAAHDWILNLDADERVPKALASEIQSLVSQSRENIDLPSLFFVPRKTYYLGKWVQHGGWYPNTIARFANRKFARWSEPSVHEELQLLNPTEGKLGRFKNPLDHFAFDTIEDQVLTNLRYSRLGSQDLIQHGHAPSLFRLLLKPVGKFFETYLLKQGFRDGIKGLIISANAAHSVFLKYAYLFEGRIRDPKFPD